MKKAETPHDKVKCGCVESDQTCSAKSGGFYCTLPEGHEGDHIACSPDRRCVHTWGRKI